MTLSDALQRRVLPRAVVSLSTVTAPRRVAATVRRALGRSGQVRLYLAFDDPYSAVALLGLADTVGGRRVELVVEPVVDRGIPADPAVNAKRRYAVIDARRLGQRAGLELSRVEPVGAEAAAFLAGWTASITDPWIRASFSAAAMRRLWFCSDGPISPEPYAALWRQLVGGDPPLDQFERVRRSETRMRRRGLYDTPIAVVHGQWFFAHERLEQIGRRLDDLGWRAS